MQLTDAIDTAEQAALREAVRELVRQHADASAWKRLIVEMGLAGLAVPEALGGVGATLAEVAVVVAETGRALTPVPYLSTALAAALLAEGGASDLLPGLLDGSATAAFAFDGDIASGEDATLTGSARFVLDGPGAAVFLVRAGERVAAVRAADATVRPVETLDQTRTQAHVTFDRAPALALTVDAGRAEQLVQVLLAVEAAAAAEHCLDATVDYLKTRVQFGRPIGLFQALRHRCADLAVEVAGASATARAAVQAAVTDDPELPVLAPLAKRHCADVFLHVAGETIQLHGGIGFTWEHEAHRYFKRAKSSQLLFGTSSQLRRVVAERAGLL